MPQRLILASRSKIRAELLHRANVAFDTENARIDEDAIKQALEADGAHPRDVADTLAEAKARKVAGRHPGVLVLGCDQILTMGRTVFSKPATKEDAISHLHQLRGQTHQLLSAAVLYENDAPVWRHVGQVQLTMRDATDVYIQDYVERNWESIRHSVGAYKLEEEGVRLFARIDGNYFNVLGLPLLELLSYLTLRGNLQA